MHNNGRLIELINFRFHGRWLMTYRLNIHMGISIESAIQKQNAMNIYPCTACLKFQVYIFEHFFVAL